MEQWYETGSLVYFESLVKNILAPGPEAVLMIANAVDVARIAQQFRKVDKSTKMVAVEWAGTQQLIELGERL
jgi:branched-chain amino acid transport system substrate-binding protein